VLMSHHTRSLEKDEDQMKLGFNMLLWTLHVTEQHLPVLENLKSCGYDGVEIPIYQGDTGHYEKLGRTICKTGLSCTACTGMPGPHANPISEDPGARQAAFDHISWCIENAAALGAGVLCGPTYQPVGCFTGRGATHEEQKRAIEFHRRIAEVAAPFKVTIAVEPLSRFHCYFMNTLADGAVLARGVNHENLGLLFDTFQANIEERDIIGAIREHAGFIRHVHISENDRSIPGHGHIDFKKIIETLQGVGYDGWLTVEAFGHEDRDLAAVLKIWRDLYDTSAQVYIEALALLRSCL